jgi:putative glycerol-1-phosphate prenyltransferase
MNTVLSKILSSKNPLFAVLIDPDKYNKEVVLKSNGIADFFLIGGSVLKNGQLTTCLNKIKQLTKLPVIVFPGNTNQLCKKADATLLLSLVSGRNSDYLIGKHVESAIQLKNLKQEIIPTAYLLLGQENNSTTQKVTNTNPIPFKDVKQIVSTAIASELLGMKMIYLEAGSGADKEIPTSIIKAVKKNVSLPVFVGGGIDSLNKYIKVKQSGADVIVIGNALEKNLSLIDDIKLNK